MLFSFSFSFSFFLFIWYLTSQKQNQVMTRIFFYLLLLAMPVSLTFANPLPQWEFSAAAAADDMPGKVMQKSEFLLSADFLAIQDDTNLLAGSYDKKLPNSGSNNLVVGGGGINLPLLVADEGFRLFNDPKDQRPVLEIDPNPAKIPPPNTPAGLCSTTSLIGLCCDDNKDTSQTLRVNCEPCGPCLSSSQPFPLD